MFLFRNAFSVNKKAKTSLRRKKTIICMDKEQIVEPTTDNVIQWNNLWLSCIMLIESIKSLLTLRKAPLASSDHMSNHWTPIGLAIFLK